MYNRFLAFNVCMEARSHKDRCSTKGFLAPGPKVISIAVIRQPT